MSVSYNVGKIVNTHGVRGDVKVIAKTDFPEERFAKGAKLWLHHDALDTPLEVTISSTRVHKHMYILHLEQFNNINDVEKYKGGMLKVTSDQLLELDEDEYYFHQIVGCEVLTDEGELLGVVKEILTPGANDVWVVKREQGKDLLVPYIDDVVLDVDMDQKKITVSLLEGLL
ncbi:ribosome maturation factor RimM [Longirhabdus pacifica]|uniref:ribosome maturation factor RimM n=1 Tax=Longirhabdus pacifica TaxID=2305227 RepID=UPI0010086D7C|nr:ribosome maturation factor RimM [Longirhabdus pacifica]